jgi:hypothetical protein
MAGGLFRNGNFPAINEQTDLDWSRPKVLEIVKGLAQSCQKGLFYHLAK